MASEKEQAALGASELTAIERRAKALEGWTEEATRLTAWVREDGARLIAEGRAARELQQAFADVATLAGEVRRLHAELEEAKAPPPPPAEKKRATPAEAQDAAAALGGLLAGPFHVTPQVVSAAQKDPLVALAVQVSRAFGPEAKDVERARLLAMSFAASRGDLDAFWSARRMRTAGKEKKAATARKK
jgi:hypothetical protein